MKTIILMFAILILAVSMIACGASQKSQTQTPQTTLTVEGTWLGTITSTDGNFDTMPFQFGAGTSGCPACNSQYQYGWIDGTYNNCNVEATGMEINTPVQTPNYFPPDAQFWFVGNPPYQIKGTITGSGTGNAATGTISFPLPCSTVAQGEQDPPWTGTFTATRQN